MFELSLRTMGLKKNEVLMVGDRISSDVIGAKNSGIKSVLLRTGEFRPQELNSKTQPEYIFDSINQILDIL